MDNKNLFYAVDTVSLEVFLKSEFAQESHIYCSFTKNRISPIIERNLEKRRVKSISFNDGHTLYPTAPEQELEEAEYY
ncbi:hypothetical protein [Vibrio scophthalmi]|uniref:Uncharacterized protein n=1 Tax=Vibrio scophthalmi LMG 19158 TaxID=870967 RepID=F9RIX9_9VIBR|nr:hypothetical protein [Vibrio scophthalmi]EGU41741.1 hypothetical protein VIS19158_11114 [Vibrio scophthalmi LMG 19158]